MIEWVPVTERLPKWDRSDAGKVVAVTVENELGERSLMFVEYYGAADGYPAAFSDEYGEVEGVVAWAEVEPYMGGVKP